PTREFCPNIVTIRGVEKRVASSPQALPKPVNPCAMDVMAFQKAIKGASKESSLFDTVGFTVVADCSDGKRIFEIPYLAKLDFKRLSHSAADLVNLYSALLKQLFPNEPINGIADPGDYEQQLVGTSFLPELKSRRYDQAFAPDWLQNTLQDYRGPVKSV